MPLPQTLPGWLALLETRHPKTIELGLERVNAVRACLELNPGFPLITVGGTNGKGSVCAYLESILTAAGYKVGCYTSPHLLRYNERVRIAQHEAMDAELVAAFHAVEQARGETPLTYFEQGTLAAMWLFQHRALDVVVLEVGLGGRLDAVNIWDADCAIVTSVDLDHQEYLGPDRESIGFEKAGIFRAGRPAICGETDPPLSLLEHAGKIGAPLLRLGQEIQIKSGKETWQCWVSDMQYADLPYPGMPGRHQLDNAAVALAALWSLRDRLPVDSEAVRKGLEAARQPGRFEIVGMRPSRVLDVAHNPHAARVLATNLLNLAGDGEVHAVFSMLGDKDIAAVIDALKDAVDHWYVAGLDVPRAADAETLGRLLEAAGEEYDLYPDVESAWHAACEAAGAADTIAAFGSFYTVAKIMALMKGRAHG